MPPRDPQLGSAAAIAAFATGILLASAGPAPAQQLIDGIAAQVGTEVVLISEVNRIANPVEQRMRAAGVSEAEIVQMKSEVLDSLIENRLLDVTAQRAEVEADPDEVDGAMRAIAAENGIDLDTLRSSVEAQGLSFAEYREKIGQEIVRQKLMGGMVSSKVEVSEGELRALYNQRYADQRTEGREVHVYHLLVPAIERKSWAIDIACQETQEKLARVGAGETFLEVAAETTPSNPDLGWIHEDDLAGWMRSGTQGLRPGDTSDVLKLDFGCSVLHLKGEREVRPTSFEEAREELEGELYDRAFERESRELFEYLRQQTYIERRGIFAATGEELDFDAEGP